TVTGRDILADHVSIHELADLLLVSAEIDGFLSVLLRHLPQAGEELQVSLVNRDLILADRTVLVEGARCEGDLEAHAEGRQRLVEVLPDLLVSVEGNAVPA